MARAASWCQERAREPGPVDRQERHAAGPPRPAGHAAAADGELLTERVFPQVSRLVLEGVQRGALRASDAEDLANEVALRVIVRLRRLGDDPGSAPIARLDDYVDSVFRHALDDYRRRMDPPRAKLAHRVRYVLSHTRALAVWGREPTLCGLAEWTGRGDRVPLPPLAGPRPQACGGARALRRMIETLIREAGAPVEVADLVDVLAMASGLGRRSFVPETTLRTLSLPPDAGETLASRQYLAQLWCEIEELPVAQRRALLLNLRLDDGDSIARALATLGVAGVRRLAAGLEMPLGELLGLWNELPLPDVRIAAMLDLTRQQVINLRRAARERLARRMGRPTRSGRRSGG